MSFNNSIIKFSTLLIFIAAVQTSLALNSFVQDTIQNFSVEIVIAKGNFTLIIKELKKGKIYQKKFFNPNLVFYDLDGDGIDEAVVIDSVESNERTSFSIYVYSFFPKFEFCDSINIGKYAPEFYDLNSEAGYFIKVYDDRFENMFGSTFPLLPILFYNLVDKTLMLDSEYSYEEYENEIDNLLNLLDDAKHGFDCNDFNARKDIQKIIGVIYADLIYMNRTFDLTKFVQQNYPCTDANELIEELRNILQ